MLRDSGVVFFLRILTVLVAIPTGVVLARYLGPSSRGIYAIVSLIPAVLSMIGNLGMGAAFVYLTGQNPNRVKDLTMFSILIAIVQGVVVTLIYLLFANFIHRSFLNGADGYPELILIPSVFPLILSLFCSSIILGRLHIVLVNVINFLFILLSAVVVFLTALLTWTLPTLLWVNLFLSYLSALVFLIIAWRVSRSERLSSFSEMTLLFKKAVAYGMKSYLANLAQFFNYRLDSFLVSMFSGLGNVGIYSVSVTMAESVWNVSNSVGGVLFPKVSSSKGSTIKRTVSINRVTFTASLILGFTLAVSSPILINILFGSKFVGSVMPLVALIPGVILMSISNVLTSDLSGRNFPNIGAVASLLSLIATVVLDVLLIPAYGPVGAAIASSFSYSLATWYVVTKYIKMYNISLKELIQINCNDIQLIKGQLRYELHKLMQ